MSAVLLVLFVGPGCDGVDHPQYGPNAPCTRNKDCRHGLACVDGVCRDPDAPDEIVAPGPDAGDAG